MRRGELLFNILPLVLVILGVVVTVIVMRFLQQLSQSLFSWDLHTLRSVKMWAFLLGESIIINSRRSIIRVTLLMKTAAHILLTAWLIFATPGVLAQNPPNVSGGHHWVPHGGSQSSQQTELRTIWNELEEHKSTVNALNSRIRSVEERIAAGSLFFLFGAFCALWAQRPYWPSWPHLAQLTPLG